MRAYGTRGRSIDRTCPCCRYDEVKPSRTRETREAFRDEERAGQLEHGDLCDPGCEVCDLEFLKRNRDRTVTRP